MITVTTVLIVWVSGAVTWFVSMFLYGWLINGFKRTVDKIVEGKALGSLVYLSLLWPIALAALMVAVYEVCLGHTRDFLNK